MLTHVYHNQLRNNKRAQPLNSTSTRDLQRTDQQLCYQPTGLILRLTEDSQDFKLGGEMIRPALH